MQAILKNKTKFEWKNWKPNFFVVDIISLVTYILLQYKKLQPNLWHIEIEINL